MNDFWGWVGVVVGLGVGVLSFLLSNVCLSDVTVASLGASGL